MNIVGMSFYTCIWNHNTERMALYQTKHKDKCNFELLIFYLHAYRYKRLQYNSTSIWTYCNDHVGPATWSWISCFCKTFIFMWIYIREATNLSIFMWLYEKLLAKTLFSRHDLGNLHKNKVLVNERFITIHKYSLFVFVCLLAKITIFLTCVLQYFSYQSDWKILTCCQESKPLIGNLGSFTYRVYPSWVQMPTYMYNVCL